MIEIINDIDLSVAQKARKAEMLNKANNMKLLENLEGGSLSLAEAVATIYEDNLARNAKTDEILATIYETILGGKE